MKRRLLGRRRMWLWAIIVLAVPLGSIGRAPGAAAQMPAGQGFYVRVNFQPSASWLPAGYTGTTDHVADIGLAYGARAQGYTYGWNQDSTANTRDRDVLAPDDTMPNSPAQENDTLILMQRNGSRTWEIAVPAGMYHVIMYSEDPSYTDSVYNTLIEGQTATNRVPGGQTSPEGAVDVRVSDGRLTVSNGPQASNNKINWIEITQLFQAKINFQPAGTPLADGYLPDYGDSYGPRGNGYTYGWNVDNRRNMRDRNQVSAQRYDTLALTQLYGAASWEIAAPQGQFTVKVVAGDPAYTDSVYKFTIENSYLVVDGTPTASNKWLEGTVNFVQIFATDGRLTISNAPGSVNNKIAFVEIQQTGVGR
jgi:hypothetical protein